LAAKKDRGTGFSVFFLRIKMGREPKKERWGWGRGRKETFPSFLPLPLLLHLLIPFFTL